MKMSYSAHSSFIIRNVFFPLILCAVLFVYQSSGGSRVEADDEVAKENLLLFVILQFSIMFNKLTNSCQRVS